MATPMSSTLTLTQQAVTQRASRQAARQAARVVSDADMQAMRDNLVEFQGFINQVRQINQNLDKAMARDWEDAHRSRKMLVEGTLPQVHLNLYYLAKDAAWRCTDSIFWDQLYSKSSLAKRSGLSPVEILIMSYQYRRDLVEMTSFLGVDGHLVMAAIKRDIPDLLKGCRVLCKSSLRETAEKLADDQIRPFYDQLDYIQDFIRPGGVMADPDLHARLAQLVVEICRLSAKNFPEAAILKDVEITERIVSFSGGFGDVWKGEYRYKDAAETEMTKAVAIKRLTRLTPNLRRSILGEAATWLNFNHRNILPFCGIHLPDGSQDPWLVSPWMENGTLESFRKKHHSVWLDKFAKEIALGVQYLHSRGIVHGDLKAANILISDTHEVQITDFGISVFSGATLRATSSNNYGSVRWQAPELHYNRENDSNRTRTKESDMYAFACTLLEMYTGEIPWGRELADEVVAVEVWIHRNRPKVTDQVPRRMALIIGECWKQAPDDRWTIDGVIKRMDILGASQSSRQHNYC